MFVVGDALETVKALPAGSVHSVITSPPYLAKRAYLPADHPEKGLEMGAEATPADFLRNLLALTDELWRVLRDDGTIWINLGDTASGSGGAGGDYADDGLRAGQPTFRQDYGTGWPRAKSVCWLPDLFGASLAYGRNLLAPDEPCRQWITRPPVTWCKPNPPVGEIIDKFREATELVVWASKQGRYYFDLDPLRVATERHERDVANGPGKHGAMGHDPNRNHNHGRPEYVSGGHPLGAPPRNWWEIPSAPYSGAHFAVFPPELIRRPVIASCPPGGVILDPFGGSGTTGQVATGHGRNALLIDLDDRNAHLARERVGMWMREATVGEACDWLEAGVRSDQELTTDA